MEREGLYIGPPSKLAGFRTQHIGDRRIGVYKSGGDNETDTEDAPPDLLESPKYVGVSDVFEPEVFCIEVRQRDEAAERDERAQRPEQIRLQFVMDTAPPVTAPAIPKDAPY